MIVYACVFLSLFSLVFCVIYNGVIRYEYKNLKKTLDLEIEFNQKKFDLIMNLLKISADKLNDVVEKINEDHDDADWWKNE